MGLPLLRLIDRAYSIQVTALWIGNIKWRKIFPSYSLHKEKVLRRPAPLTGLITPIMYYRIKISLCAFTQGENLTPLGHIKLVAARQGEFQ